MVLYSLYITDFREITGQAFHFCPKYIIEYSGSPESLTISIKLNSNFIDNFFGHSNIKSVTALIGQNGSGKTSTLDFIKNNLSMGAGDIDGYSITIVEKSKNDDYDGREELRRVYYPAHWNIILNDETNSFTTIAVMMNKSGAMVSWDKIEAFDTTSIVFYSNIFDGKEEIERDGYFDISTNYLLRKDQERFHGVSQVEAFNESELSRQLLFLSSDTPQKKMPFDLPKNLNVTILKDDEIALKDIFHNFGLSSIYNVYSDTSYLYMESSGFEEFFLTELHVAAFFNFIRADFEFGNPSLLKEKIYKIETENIKETIARFFYYTAQDQTNTFMSNWALMFTDFLDYVTELINKGILIIGGQAPSYPLHLAENRTEIEALLNKYVRVKGFTNFLKFDWSDLSSGQKSLLNVFSRFYSLKDEINTEDNRLQKNVLILIDEGDLYFHPEWQRRFLKILIDFLPIIYPNKNLQLILASNSPFIASDLPKSYVIFIDKNRRVLPSINSKEETFASNIHTLFADSFFMEEILIGDFAKSKLDQVIDYLHSNQFTDELTKKYRAIVNLIGEPVIKYKIEELWIEKLGAAEEIKILESRIKELQKRNNDSN